MTGKTLIFRIFAVAGLLLLFSQAYCQKEKTQVRGGNRDYNKGKYHAAEINYRKALDIKPLLNEAEFNLGNSLYMQENYSEAALSYLATAERSSDNKIKASSFYNLGNCLYSAEKYGEAVEAYKESLRKNPTDEARHNLELAKKMLQQSGQDKQKSDENQESDEKQDQEDGDSQQDDKNSEKSEQQQQQSQEGQQDGEQQEVQQIEISEEDAERILEAMKNEEQETMMKVLEQKNKGQKVKIDKDW